MNKNITMFVEHNLTKQNNFLRKRKFKSRKLKTTLSVAVSTIILAIKKHLDKKKTLRININLNIYIKCILKEESFHIG